MAENPSHELYNVLKDFQPLMAAAVALAAAYMAFRGAPAKVTFDRQVDTREQNNRRRGLQFRLRSQLSRLRDALETG
jgi:hypothetical protein